MADRINPVLNQYKKHLMSLSDAAWLTTDFKSQVAQTSFEVKV